LLTAYSIGEASSIQTRKIRVESPRIPSKNRLFESDRSPTYTWEFSAERKRSRKIAEIIKREKPDVLVSTGTWWTQERIRFWRKPPSSPKSILLSEVRHRGNHEFYHEGGRDSTVSAKKRVSFL
jgi:hypothetical protein